MPFRSPIILPLLCLVLFAGCVSTSDFDSMQTDVSQLKKETADLRKDMVATKELLAGAAKEETFNAIRESQTSLYSQVSDLSKDLQILRGRFDENKFFIDKTLKDDATERELLRSQIGGLETRLKELNDKLAKLVGSSSTSNPPAESPEKKDETELKGDGSSKNVKAAAGEESIEDDPVKAYEAAYELFADKQYKESREKFNAFVKRFPKDTRVSSAQFWIAEDHYAEKDYEGAILAYETVIKKYPNSEKVPSAFYKQGLSFMELSDKKTAKAIFQTLIEKYPDSKQAKLAKEKIAEIDKKSSKGKSKR
ncbi:MAG: tol-pal system protein YbgF [Thermodesulfovibrionales bacterium]|jgi:tol-pal system protein YbgF